MAESLANLNKGDREWKLLASVPSGGGDISFASLEFSELAIMAKGDATSSKAVFISHITKVEIDVIGSDTVWITEGGYYGATINNFMNYSINGATKSIHPNATMNSGVALTNVNWYVFYK